MATDLRCRLLKPVTPTLKTASSRRDQRGLKIGGNPKKPPHSKAEISYSTGRDFEYEFISLLVISLSELFKVSPGETAPLDTTLDTTVCIRG